MPPTPHPITPRPLTIVVWESVPTNVSKNAAALAVLLAQVNHLGQVLQVDLVDDPRARRHHREVTEGFLRPLQKGVALFVALKLALHVAQKRFGAAKKVDLYRVVDDQVRGDQRVNLAGVAALRLHRGSHRREVGYGRYAREVL